MSEYICDDRNDVVEEHRMIRAMTDEEFDIYIEKLKEEEMTNAS